MLDVRNPLAPIVVGSGLIITVNPGNLLLAGVPTNIPATTISLTQAATNFVHITSGGAVAVNTSAFPSTALPIAKIICSATSITSIIDSRPDFTLAASGASTPVSVFSPWGSMISGISLSALSGANKIQLSGFFAPNPVTLSNIVVNVSGTDAVNNYDWGIYDTSGNLQAHVGARTVPSSGVTDIAVVNTPVTLAAGKYYFAFTGTAATATLCRASGQVANTNVTFLALTESSTSSSAGALPSSVTVPADSWAVSIAVHGFALH